MTFYHATYSALHEGPIDLQGLLARARLGDKSPALVADLHRTLLRSGRMAFAELWQGETRQMIEAFLLKYYEGDEPRERTTKRHPLVDALAIYSWQSDQHCQEIDRALDGDDAQRLAYYMCAHIDMLTGEPFPFRELDAVFSRAIDAAQGSDLSVDNTGDEIPLYGHQRSAWWAMVTYFPSYPYEMDDPLYREDEDMGWHDALENHDTGYTELCLAPEDQYLRFEWLTASAYRQGVPQDHIFGELARELDNQGPWWISQDSYKRLPEALAAAMSAINDELVSYGRAEAVQILGYNQAEIRQAGRDAGADYEEDEEDY